MPFDGSELNKYIDKKVGEIDSAIEEKTSYLKIIQDKLDYYDTLLRRRNVLSAIIQYLDDNAGNLNNKMDSMVRSIIRSLIFDIDSENVVAKKQYNTQRKNAVESEIQFLKKRKQEILDIKNLYASP